MNDFYSYIMLGKYGRLGNQMFQVAATSCLAKNRNVDLVLPNDESTVVRKYFDIPCIDLKQNHLNSLIGRWEERSFSYDESINNIPTKVDVLGYLQSWKYITDEKYVRKLFTFKEDLLKKVNNNIPKGRKVAIHVRRGDYLKYPDIHPIPSIDYYMYALKQIKNIYPNITPIVFTDDVDWCKSNFNNFLIISEDEIYDMCMMSMCNDHIIANSSFSWWAAWLGKSDDQVVYSPQKWFGENGPQDVQDLLPTKYRRI